MRLQGKTALVTGAGRGIGAAYARAAAGEGARVVVNDIDAEVAEQVAADIRERGGAALAKVADISRFCAPIRAELAKLPARMRVIAEPGRYICGPAAIGVASVMGRARP